MKNSIFFIVILGTLFAFFSTFFLESIFSFVVLLLMLNVFNRRNIPFPVQFYFLFFFLQIFTVFVYVDFSNLDNSDMLNYINLDSTAEVSMVSLFQLLIMVVVFSFFFNSKSKLNSSELMETISRLKFKNLIIFYFFMSFFFPILSALTSNNPSLQQFFMALAVLKDFVLILFAFHFFFFTKNRMYIALIFIFEFLLGFISYFSNFKTILIYIIIVSLTLITKVSFKTTFRLITLLVFTVVIMSFWSSIKGDYREYASNGQISQSVNIDNELAGNFIFNKLQSFTYNDFKIGFSRLLKRIQYIQEYQTVRQNVPLIITHQNGKLTMDAVLFNLSPRFLNPDKKQLDPSSKTAEFTMRQVANVEQGTSISLGFFADFYIDYGFFNMTFALIFISYILALFFRRVLFTNKYSIVFNLSILIAIITHIGTFESDLTFFLGILRNYLVVYFFCDFVVFNSLFRYLSGIKKNTNSIKKAI